MISEPFWVINDVLALVSHKNQTVNANSTNDAINLNEVNATVIKETDEIAYVSYDGLLDYAPFFDDFGPNNLGNIIAFCRLLFAKILNEGHEDIFEGKVDQEFKTSDRELNINKKRLVYYYTTFDAYDRTNAIFLLGSFLILVLKYSLRDVESVFASVEPPPIPYPDAGIDEPSYFLKMTDCWSAVQKARDYNFVNFETFDLDSCRFFERVENGDLSWIIPNQVLAFAGPIGKEILDVNETLRDISMPPDHYISLFHEPMFNVKFVVRLNNPMYEKEDFENANYIHGDYIFTDGAPPLLSMAKAFVSDATTILNMDKNDDRILFDNELRRLNGSIAVHCKAGLGRTGTMIACLLMRWYHFSAAEAIAWTRMCRPGSIIGKQQNFLEASQPVFWGTTNDIPALNDPLYFRNEDDSPIEETEGPLRDDPTLELTDDRCQPAAQSYINKKCEWQRVGEMVDSKMIRKNVENEPISEQHSRNVKSLNLCLSADNVEKSKEESPTSNTPQMNTHPKQIRRGRSTDKFPVIHKKRERRRTNIPIVSITFGFSALRTSSGVNRKTPFYPKRFSTKKSTAEILRQKKIIQQSHSSLDIQKERENDELVRSSTFSALFLHFDESGTPNRSVFSTHRSASIHSPYSETPKVHYERRRFNSVERNENLEIVNEYHPTPPKSNVKKTNTFSKSANLNKETNTSFESNKYLRERRNSSPNERLCIVNSLVKKDERKKLPKEQTLVKAKPKAKTTFGTPIKASL